MGFTVDGHLGWREKVRAFHILMMSDGLLVLLAVQAFRAWIYTNIIRQETPMIEKLGRGIA